MGLDMYLFEIIKIEEEEKEELLNNLVEDYSNKYAFLNKEYVDMFSTALPLLTEVPMKQSYIDIDKIKSDNNIPADAYILCKSHIRDKITLTFSYKVNEEQMRKDVSFQVGEYEIIKDVTFYVCKMVEVFYWRKAYEVQDAIHEACYTDIENCGYYVMTEEMFNAIYDTDPDFFNEYKCGKENIFYHEWY